MARQISLNAQSPTGELDRFYSHCVGAGRAHELLRADALDQLSMLQAECGFQYIRFHGLLCDDMAVYHEDASGNPLYNWQYVDMVFDRLLALGLRPLVELGFMPDRLKSGDQTLFWWRGNVTPPADMAKWHGLIYALVSHWEARYGADEIIRWYFEVWNEPNLKGLFFTGDMQSYFDLYDASVSAIKAVNPLCRVGGPATAEASWIAEIIGHCVKQGIALDFISTHSYGVTGCLDEFGEDLHTLIPDRDSVARNVRQARRQIDESPLPGLPLFFTEWSSSYSSRDSVHDSYINAPFILHTLSRCRGYAASMSYWTFTDIFEEGGPGPAPFHGGFGLLTQQGLRKPSYYAYRFLCALPELELATGDADSLAAVSGDGCRIGLLLWRYCPPETSEPNESYFIRDLPPVGREDISVRLEGLSGCYRLRISRVGYEANDVYTAYLKMGLRKLHGRETPTPRQIGLLRASRAGLPQEERTVSADAHGVVAFSLSLRDNDVLFVTLERDM